MKRILAITAALLVLPALAFGAYESAIGIYVIPFYRHPGKPVNFKFDYDFSHGMDSFGGTWRAFSGGGAGDGAAVYVCEGAVEEAEGVRFDFELPPGGDTWALLNFTPGRYSGITLEPEDGIFFRARTHNHEMDGYPARWRLQLRVLDEQGNIRVYHSENTEITDIWYTYYVSALDFGDETMAGLFAGGRKNVRLFDLSFIPHVEKQRKGSLLVDALTVWCPGKKVPGIDSDGDGLLDYVDGDEDNDGIQDFAQKGEGPLHFVKRGYVSGYGQWEGRFTIRDPRLKVGETLSVDAEMRIRSKHLVRAIDQIPELVALLVGERRHDKEGYYHAFTNHRISSLITPTGFPVENHQPNVPTRHCVSEAGTCYTSPIDAVSRVPRTEIRVRKNELFLTFRFRVPITREIPEGHWWLYFEFGVIDKDGYFVTVPRLPYEAQKAGIGDVTGAGEALHYELKNILPMIRIGDAATPRLPWTLFGTKEVHGVRGIVPEEAEGKWDINWRNRLESEPIYPPGRYRLEPGLPSVAFPSLNIRYPFTSRRGEVSVQVTGPDGETSDLGTHRLVALTKWGATTRTGKLTRNFTKYGRYRVRMTGWMLDAYGNRFEGGGTYSFWIAHRITFGTFPSLPYEVGQTFHGALEVAPPVPADIELTIEFYPYSDPAKKEVFKTRAKANRLGLFVGPEKYVFKAPGEYVSKVWAKYEASDGTLWLGSLWGAMVVAEPDTPMIAHGRTGYQWRKDGTELTNMVGPLYTLPSPPRFSLKEEGRVENLVSHFFFFPYYCGDVLYMASTFDLHNYITPYLTMEFTDGFEPYPDICPNRGLYAPFPTARNHWTPFCFPEEVDRIAYFYADAWRPGVSGRHIIGIHQDSNSYWSTSPSILGNQMHTCENGDMPGDFYRNTGGVVYKNRKTGETRYAVYASMDVITPEGTNDNRIVAPCSEPLFTLNGREHYLFVGGGVLPVPGMILLEGGGAPAGGASNPPVPADLETTVISPSGREFVYRLKANKIGVFPRSPDNVTPLSEPGVWKARQELAYAGRTGDVLGSLDGEYAFYVAPKDPARAFEIDLDLPPFSRVQPGQPVLVSGTIPDDVAEGVVHYTIISPGVIVEEASVPMEDGSFRFVFDPWTLGERLPFYDTMDHLTGRPILADTLVFNLFFEGKRRNGKEVWGTKVFVMRGDKVINANVK